MLSATLNISIQKDSPVPIRDQIVEQIGLLIASGVLAGSQKLPSIRALATKLGIHHGIVNAAYNQLSDMGLLEIRQGSGVKVVAKAAVAHEKGQSSLDSLFRYFLAQASDLGYSRKAIEECIKHQMGRRPVERILIVDNAPDFHHVVVAELKPHFNLPIEVLTHEGLKKSPELIEDSLIVTSLYHLLSLEELPLDPTRFIVCHIEPGISELELIKSLPKSSIVLAISKSETLLKASARLAAAIRGEEIAVRTISLDDMKEITYMMRFAKAVFCDLPSKEAIEKVAGKIPVQVFRVYSPATIKLIEERLAQWG
jgi:DNA-binding transcriptional regulator YhcF (GntR family)